MLALDAIPTNACIEVVVSDYHSRHPRHEPNRADLGPELHFLHPAATKRSATTKQAPIPPANGTTAALPLDSAGPEKSNSSES